MTRTSAPQRLGTYQKRKQFWFFSVLQAVVLFATSYLVAVFTYLVIVHLSEMPHGPLWDDSFRAPLAFVLTVVAAIGLLVPYFQKEWDGGMRGFSILSAFFLLAFASLSRMGIADPKIPLQLISTYLVEPLGHFLKI